ncbi:MAG: HD domain-containing protein [Pirellulales bacterium]
MPVRPVPLYELAEDQEADFYALLSEKQELTTRDGKPYHRVSFRDAQREVNFPIWSDSPLAVQCRNEWAAGQFYKIRGVLRQSNYGAQLDIKKIRPVEDADRKEGFDPLMCQPTSRFDPIEMFAEIMNIVEGQIADAELRQLVSDILEQHREALLALPAARRNHHAVVSGYLEHVLNVSRTCCHLADKYADLYNDLDPPLNKDVAIAGAVLHDIGKLRELTVTPAGAEYSAAGSLIGHVLQGRDIVREAATGRKIEPETLLRLEHVIVSHHRLPEWGAPKPPMTPEALIVHHADDLDAKLNMMVACLKGDTTPGPVTTKRNPLAQSVYRGGF